MRQNKASTSKYSVSYFPSWKSDHSPVGEGTVGDEGHHQCDREQAVAVAVAAAAAAAAAA